MVETLTLTNKKKYIDNNNAQYISNEIVQNRLDCNYSILHIIYWTDGHYESIR